MDILIYTLLAASAIIGIYMAYDWWRTEMARGAAEAEGAAKAKQALKDLEEQIASRSAIRQLEKLYSTPGKNKTTTTHNIYHSKRNTDSYDALAGVAIAQSLGPGYSSYTPEDETWKGHGGGFSGAGASGSWDSGSSSCSSDSSSSYTDSSSSSCSSGSEY